MERPDLVHTKNTYCAASMKRCYLSVPTVAVLICQHWLSVWVLIAFSSGLPLGQRCSETPGLRVRHVFQSYVCNLQAV